MSSPAHRLKLLRQSAGFNSARMAAVTKGLDPALYASHEEGRRNLTIAAAARYAKAFGGAAGYLLFGEGGLPLPPPGLTIFSSTDIDGLFTYLEALHRTKPGPASTKTPYDACFGFVAPDSAMTEKPDSPFAHDSIAAGDTVLFYPDLDVHPGCIVLALGHNLRIRRWQPPSPDAPAENSHGHLVAADPYVSGIEKIARSTVIAVGRGIIRPFSTVPQPILTTKRKRT